MIDLEISLRYQVEETIKFYFIFPEGIKLVHHVYNK